MESYKSGKNVLNNRNRPYIYIQNPINENLNKITKNPRK